MFCQDLPWVWVAVVGIWKRKNERERVWFTSHPCEHIKTNTTGNMSELVSERTSVCVLAWASSLAVADCWLAVSSFSSPFIFRTPGFSVLTEREVHNNTRERQIEEKKEREAVGLRKGGTSVSTFPHLNVFLHSWQQPTMSSQGEMGLEKEWKRTSKTNPGKWISALFSD